MTYTDARNLDGLTEKAMKEVRTTATRKWGLQITQFYIRSLAKSRVLRVKTD